MRPDQADSPDIVRLFLNEAKILGQLEHAGVVPVHDSGELSDGRPFYAMKRVVGDTLEDVLKRRPESNLRCPHNTAHLIDIFESICQTVAYAHVRGIIHRDLKPANIMIGEFGAVSVMDWGLSKQLESDAEDQNSTKVGAVRGTPAYMSPEQAEGKTDTIDYRSDVFALGVMLYEILTGQRPFSGKSVREILSSVVYSEPDNPLRLRRCINRDLVAICRKALEKDPAKRYPSATELARDLRAYLEHREISARRLSAVGRTWKWVRRHPTLASICATALLISGFWGGAHVYHLRQQQQIDSWALREVAALEQRVAEVDQHMAEAGDADKQFTRQRFVLQERIKIMLAGIVARGMPKPHPDVLAKLRGILMAEAAALLDDHAYAEADYRISGLLDRCTGENILAWSEQDVAALSAMQKRCRHAHGQYMQGTLGAEHDSE